LVSVHGAKPPRDALLGLRLAKVDHRLWASWSDGLNEHDMRWQLTRTGEFRRGATSESAVGCVGTCTHPSGFGVSTARGLRLTPTGRLVFLDRHGTETARYRRVS
jgi:hypothetical protein